MAENNSNLKVAYEILDSEHELAFHGKRDAKRLESEFAALQRPLLALAPPKWYCRDTKAFGPLAENDRALYGDPLLRPFGERRAPPSSKGVARSGIGSIFPNVGRARMSVNVSGPNVW